MIHSMNLITIHVLYLLSNYFFLVRPFGRAFVSFNTCIMSNPLQSIAGFAAPIVGGLLQNSQSMHNNERLMGIQYMYGQKAAEQAYNRQRELTHDSWSLNKQGMVDAGINPAFVDGASNNVASVQAADVPSNSTVNAPDYSSALSQGVQYLLNSSQIQADNRLKNAQARSQEIKNDFEIDNQLANLRKMLDEHKISQSDYDIRVEELTRLRDTHDSYVKQEDEKANQAEFDTQIKEIQVKQEETKNEILAITKQLNDEQLKQAKFITDHQLQQYISDCAEQASRIRANYASAASSFASAAASSAQALLTRTQNALEKAKVPHAAELAKAFADQAKYSATLTFNQAIGVGFDNAPKAREAQYQNYIKGQENSWIGRNIFYNMRGVFDNSLGNVFKFAK